jgi:nucleoside triphosphate diphosphatase
VLWGEIKAQEKAARRAARIAAGQDDPEAKAKSLLDDVPAILPALTQGLKLQAKAGTVGFDWNDPRAVLAKIREEIDEIEDALDADDKQAVAGEIGDVLFAMVNLARHLSIDPEQALAGTNAKFRRRFAFIETALAAQNRTLPGTSLDEMEALWQQAKADE